MPRRSPTLVLLLLLGASPAFAQREFGFDNRKPSGQPYLRPEETVKRFKVAPEFEVKLFASEPNCVNPIAFTIDEKGRVWVIECFEYPSRTPKGKAPRDRIVILEDTDGDGACDKRTVFAEGKDFPVTEERKNLGLGAFDLASGIEVGNGGVYVGAPPYLWFIENKNDKPGKFETLLKGFGSEDTHETLNTFQWGPDGWLYGLHGVFTHSKVQSLDGPETRMNAAVWRFHPRTKKFEIFAEGTSNPWGMDWRNTDGQFILCCCVIPHLFHIVPGGTYKRQAGISFNPFAYDLINEICDHTFHRESGWAHAGLISLDAPHIPEKYRNSVIFGSIHGCSIKQNILKPNGSTYTASRGDDFLVSGDKNFRPINLKWGPGGDIYLIDWHDQNPCHQAKPEDWDYERGRVYRLQLKGTQPKKPEDLGKKTPAELLRMINDPNPYRYRTAMRLLAGLSVEDRKAVAPPLIEKGEKMELRELWAAHHLSRFLDISASGEGANPGPDPGPRIDWLVRTVYHAEEVASDAIPNLAEAAKKSKSATLRRELASAAIRLSDKHDVTLLLRALMANKEDAKDPVIPQLVWLAYEKVLPNKPEPELAWLAGNAPGNPLITDRIVPNVMRRLAFTARPAELTLCLQFAADSKDAAVRRKALEGLSIALKDQIVDAPAGWSETQKILLAANDPATTALVNALSVSFRDPAAVARAQEVLRSSKQSDASRVEAVRQLALLRPEGIEKTLVSVIRQGFPLAVKLEAARGLARFGDPKTAKDLLGLWKSQPPQLRAELANTLASRRPWAQVLLQALSDKTIDRLDVTDSAVTRIQAFNDRELNSLIEKAWGRSRPTPKELTAQIDKMRNELTFRPGSFARGKAVFETQCAKCHQFDGAGSAVGPALDGAGRDIEYLLANILDPNRVIGAPYFIHQVNTLDGQLIQGLLAGDDELSLTLKIENGVLRKLARTDLDGGVKILEKSMMPEGLAANMTAQDFRDLVRYLMLHPYLTEWTLDGTPISSGVGGFTSLRPPPKIDQQIVLEAKVTATADLTTRLLIDCRNPYEVKLDGKAIATGKRDKRNPEPESFAVALPKGEHTLTLVIQHTGVTQSITARFLDPDRKLLYPDAGAKK